jgi:SAM-dependent methyltransferase
MDDRYRNAFAWQSSYGHLVRLVEEIRPKAGVVIDLGCGYAAVAEPLAARGYEYVGTDTDTDALADVAARGFETHELDLVDTERLPERLLKIADGRRVAAVLALDVMEHVYPTHAFLGALRESVGLLDGAPLFVSVPNVAHVDVAAKLVFGRWDVTPSGLLDETHVSFFTDARLRDETRRAGFLQVGANDFHLPHSDQHFPDEHPALAGSSPPAQLMRAWRGLADEHADTNQFVRAYLAADLDVDARVDAPLERFATVIMRTQGRRLPSLREALTCLAGQTDDDFDVLLMVHTEDLDLPSTVEAVVAEFHPTFAGRVAVVPVRGGGRSRPLNRALERATGRYVCFLDDDDLVTANWIEAFRSIEGAGFLRSTTVERKVSWPDAGEHLPYHVESGFDHRWDVPFDMARQLWQNHTPICSFALARAVIETYRLRFDEDLPVIEDWHFLMRAAFLTTVAETGEITSIYHRWQRGESSTSLHDEELWQATHRTIIERFDSLPLVLPPGSASRLQKLWGEVEMAQHVREISTVEVEAMAARVDAIERSRWWLMTRPAARAVERVRPRLGRVRRLLGRLRGRAPES